MKSNILIIVILVIVLGGGLYWYMTGQSGNDAPLMDITASANPAQTQFQMLVSQLQPISFDTGIFSDPRFTALVDITTPLVPETSGRIDPFAPIPGVIGGN